MSDNFIELCNRIRENITPRGDGNFNLSYFHSPPCSKIREKLHKGTEIKNIAFYEKLN